MGKKIGLFNLNFIDTLYSGTVYSLINNIVQKSTFSYNKDLLPATLAFIQLGRWILLAGVIIRFAIFQPLVYNDVYYIPLISLLFLVFCFNLVTTFALVYRIGVRSSHKWLVAQIIFETLVVTGLYYLTRDAQSDFFLLYFVPIFVASLTLSLRETVYFFLCLIAIFLVVIFSIESGLSSNDIIGRIFLPRYTFFMAVFFLLYSTNLVLSRTLHILYTRSQLLQKLRDIDRELNQSIGNENLLAIVCQKCLAAFNAIGVHIRVKESDPRRGEFLRIAGCEGIHRDILPKETKVTDDNLSSYMKAYLNKEAQIVDDPYDDVGFQEFRKLQAENAEKKNLLFNVDLVKSFGCFPILVEDGEPLGVLTISFGSKKSSSDWQLISKDINDFCQRIGYAIQHNNRIRSGLLLDNFARAIGQVISPDNFSTDEFDNKVDYKLDHIINEVLKSAYQLLGASGGKIYRMRHDGASAELRAVAGLAPDLPKVGYNIPINDEKSGVVREAIRSKTPIIENKYSISEYRMIDFMDSFDSMVAVPILDSMKRVLGGLVVFNKDNPSRGNNFTYQYDVPILEGFAAQIGLILHTSEQLRQEHLLKEFASAAASSISIKSVSENILSYLAEFIDFDSGSVQHVVRDKLTIVGCRGFGNRENDVVGVTFNIKESRPNATVAQNKELLLVDDVRKIKGFNDIEGSEHVCSWLGIPLVADGVVVGIITLDRITYRPFSNEDKKLAQKFCKVASVAFNKSILFEKTQTLREVSQKISEAQEIDQITAAILHGLKVVVGYDSATIQKIEGKDSPRVLLDCDGISAPVFKGWALKPISSDRLINYIDKMPSPKILVLPNTKTPEAEKKYGWKETNETRNVSSWIGMILSYRGRTVGLVTLDHKSPNFYQERDKELLSLFMGQCAQAVENAILIKRNKEIIETLESAIEYLHNYERLATIGLIYGEDFHFASDKLGSAKAIAQDIAEGYYDKSIEDIKEEAKVISQNINDYLKALTNTRKKALDMPTPTPMDLHKLLEKVIKSKGNNTGILINYNPNARNSFIFAPERQLRQVLYVIIENAIDATRRKIGATIDIRTDGVEVDGDKFICIMVRDNGSGMTVEEQANLFHMKERDISKSRGSALGLIWSYSFLKTYKGDIQVDSTVGEGTTIFIYVPKDFRGREKTPESL